MFGSEQIRPFKDDILVQVLFGITEDLSAAFVMDQDLRYRPEDHRVGLFYRMLSGFVSEVTMEWFDGDDALYFGQWRDNDRVVFLLRWTP